MRLRAFALTMLALNLAAACHSTRDDGARSGRDALETCEEPPDDNGDIPVPADDTLACTAAPPSSSSWPSAQPPTPTGDVNAQPDACRAGPISCLPLIDRVHGDGSAETDPKNCQDISFEGCARLIAAGCNCSLVHVDCEEPKKVGHFVDSVEVACPTGSPAGTRCFVLNDPERRNTKSVQVPPGGDAGAAITAALAKSNMNPCGAGKPYHVEFGPGDRHPCSWPGNARPPYNGDVDCSPINPDGGGAGLCCSGEAGAGCEPPPPAFCQTNADCAAEGGTCCTDFLATPYCTNIMTDTANCGGCGSACADGCCNGTCCPAPP